MFYVSLSQKNKKSEKVSSGQFYFKVFDFAFMQVIYELDIGKIELELGKIELELDFEIGLYTVQSLLICTKVTRRFRSF